MGATFPRARRSGEGGYYNGAAAVLPGGTSIRRIRVEARPLSVVVTIPSRAEPALEATLDDLRCAAAPARPGGGDGGVQLLACGSAGDPPGQPREPGARRAMAPGARVARLPGAPAARAGPARASCRGGARETDRDGRGRGASEVVQRRRHRVARRRLPLRPELPAGHRAPLPGMAAEPRSVDLLRASHRAFRRRRARGNPVPGHAALRAVPALLPARPALRPLPLRPLHRGLLFRGCAPPPTARSEG